MGKRICVFCHKVGISIEFDKGNELKRHVRVRHPDKTKTPTQKQERSIRAYRKSLLLQRTVVVRRD